MKIVNNCNTEELCKVLFDEYDARFNKVLSEFGWSGQRGMLASIARAEIWKLKAAIAVIETQFATEIPIVTMPELAKQIMEIPAISINE